MVTLQEGSFQFGFKTQKTKNQKIKNSSENTFDLGTWHIQRKYLPILCFSSFFLSLSSLNSLLFSSLLIHIHIQIQIQIHTHSISTSIHHAFLNYLPFGSGYFRHGWKCH